MLTDRAPHTTPPAAATSASGFDDEQRQALREAAAMSADRARVVAQVATLEGHLQELGRRGQERLGPAEGVLRRQIAALEAVRSGDASASEAPAPSEVEALATAVAEYVSLFEDVVLTALGVTRVQLVAVGELLDITDREIEARARALLVAQTATYVRGILNQAVM